jgi:V/A-type H+-transporting ATPase subunit E
MEHQKLIERISKGGEQEAENILAEARQKAFRIIEEKREEARRKAWEEMGKAVRDAEAEARRIIEAASFDGRRKAHLATIQEKQKLLDQVFEEVKNKLREFGKTSKYDQFLQTAIKRSSIVAGGGELELLMNKQDAMKDLPLRRIAEEVAEITGRNTTFKVSNEKLETIGGVMIRTADGKAVVDSRLESIIDRKRRELEPEIARILFSEDTKQK